MSAQCVTSHRRSLTLRARCRWKYAHEVSLLRRFGFMVDRLGDQNAKARRLTSGRKKVFNMYDVPLFRQAVALVFFWSLLIGIIFGAYEPVRNHRRGKSK
jgi:hypothetical protein